MRRAAFPLIVGVRLILSTETIPQILNKPEMALRLGFRVHCASTWVAT